MLGYFRKNIIAFVALFISIIAIGGTTAYAVNTVRSADIVDGQVRGADLAANSVGSGKIVDNTVLGVDIRESTMSRVPDAARVAGRPAVSFRNGGYTRTANTSSCVVVGIWTPCAPITIAVPAGHEYRVTVHSTITALATATARNVNFCAAKDGPTCINGGPDALTLWANGYTSGATAATAFLPAGTYTFSTALQFSGAIAVDNTFAHTTTTIEFSDVALLTIN